MFDIIVLIVVMLFFSIGVYFTVTEIAALLKPRTAPCGTVIEISGADSAENELRSALSRYKGEITALYRGSDEETIFILGKMSEQYPNITVKRE